MRLAWRGVELRLDTQVKEVRADGVVVNDGEFVKSGLVIWASGIKVPDRVRDWGLPQDRGGRIEVDENLRVKGFDNVFAVGDIALTQEQLPQLAQPALQGGKFVGTQLSRLVAGEPLNFWPEGDNGDWQVGPDEPVADVLAAYRAAIAHSDEIISARRLSDPPARPETWWHDAGLDFPDLRTIVVHVLVETSVHAGHLDAARELLDGRQHLVI